MGLAWQQGPLAPGAIGRFLVPDPLPERLLYAKPLRRRMLVRFGGAWIADSEGVVLLPEPGRNPTSWYAVSAGENSEQRAEWQDTQLPDYASELKQRVAFAWRAMDTFYGQSVIPHDIDRDLTLDDAPSGGRQP
jgi:uncharacterized protein (DUF427 family)